MQKGQTHSDESKAKIRITSIIRYLASLNDDEFKSFCKENIIPRFNSLRAEKVK